MSNHVIVNIELAMTLEDTTLWLEYKLIYCNCHYYLLVELNHQEVKTNWTYTDLHWLVNKLPHDKIIVKRS